jgi:hypothetical protein
MELFIFARFHVRDGKEGEARAVLRDQAKYVRNEAGCLAIHVFASVRDPRAMHSLHWIYQRVARPADTGCALRASNVTRPATTVIRTVSVRS